MNFNPTNNYYNLDFSIDENITLWNFWEFIKNLVILSSPAQKQRQIMGLGTVTDEMVLDFDSYFTLKFQVYLEHHLLTNNQVEKLKILDNFLEERSGEQMPTFWEDEALDYHVDWKKVRMMAKEILQDLGYSNLTIELEREVKKSWFGRKSLVVESTKTRLRVI